jgi:hypothetical protein
MANAAGLCGEGARGSLWTGRAAGTRMVVFPDGIKQVRGLGPQLQGGMEGGGWLSNFNHTVQQHHSKHEGEGGRLEPRWGLGGGGLE